MRYDKRALQELEQNDPNEYNLRYLSGVVERLHDTLRDANASGMIGRAAMVQSLIDKYTPVYHKRVQQEPPRPTLPRGIASKALLLGALSLLGTTPSRRR